VHQHGRLTLAAVINGQPNERRRKAGQHEQTLREGHGVLGRTRENLLNVGDIKNDTADLWTKGDLRVKRRDPWHRANALSKAAADPALSGEDVEMQSQSRLDLVRKPVAQTPAETS